MSNLPVAPTVDDNLPAGGVQENMSTLGRAEKERLAVSLAAVTDGDVSSKRDTLNLGDPFVIAETRTRVAPDPLVTQQSLISDSYQAGSDPQNTARLLFEEQKKQSDWVLSGESFYLEHALSLGDPNIDHETMVLATNLTVAETMLQDAMEDNTDVGLLKPFKYAVDAIDRWFIRAVPIGGIEALTNRPERMGNELIGAAATMAPEEFKAFFANRIAEMSEEGFLKDDNIFALGELQYALNTVGEDPWETFNRTVGILDIAAFGAPLKTGVKGAARLVRAATPVQRVAALKGPEAATQVAEAMAKRGDMLALEDLKPQVLDGKTNPVVRTRVGKTAEIQETNDIVRGIGEYVETGALGRSVKSPEVVRAGEELVEQFRKVSNNPIQGIKYAVRPNLTGIPVAKVTMGTIKTGKPYPTEASTNFMVKKVRDNGFPTAKAVPVDPDDITKGWFIETETMLDVGSAIDPLSMPAKFNPIRQAIASVVGSRRSVEAELLNDLATMNEGSRDVIGQMVKPELKKIDAVNSESKRIISDIYTAHRDGADAFIRDGLSEGQLIDRWNQVAGRDPTAKEIDAFNAIRSVNDAAYIMAAHGRLQQYVMRGFHGADILPAGTGRLAPIRAVEQSELTKGTKVRDAKTNQVFKVGGKGFPKNQRVWYVDEPMEDGIRFVTKVPEVKMLSHHDVMPYNAGGRRLNPDANWFVTSGTENPKALFQAFSEAQATKGLDDLSAIQARVTANGGLDTLARSDELDEFIRKHNEWNPEIQGTDDLLQWAKDKNVDLSLPIAKKARDAQPETGEVTFGFSDDWGEHFGTTLHRYDDALMEYGGKEARQRDPITAIFGDFTSQAAQFSHSVYNQTAIQSWVKAASKKGSGWTVPKGSDPRRQFENATRDGANRSNMASEMDYQRSIIESRMNMNGEYGRRMAKLGVGIQEFVFQKTGAKLANDTAQNLESKALGLGFQSVFGFFNPAQFLVQGMHATTIAAISPRHGIKAATMALPMRMALMAGSSAEESLMLGRLAKGMGISTKEMDETMEFIRQSGRGIIEGSAIQKGVERSWGASGWKGESWRSNDFMASIDKGVEQGLDKMTIFFREGEGVARMTAQLTAIAEFKAKYPNLSIFDDFARREIGRREKDLSFRMTNADRAAVQQGIGKIPTQWFSYSMRAMEMVTIGRGFTKMERARMAFMLTGFYGAAGFGAERAMETIADKMGAEAGGTLYTALRGGVLDTLASWVGVDVDLSGRLAPISLYTDMYKDVVEGDKSMLSILTGPAGDIGGGFAGNFWKAMTDLGAGRTHSMNEDLVRSLRNISSVDNAYKALGIMQNGTYRSRSGSVFPGEMGTSDAIAQLMGFSPRELGQWYERQDWQGRNKKSRLDFQKSMIADLSLAWDQIHAGNESGWDLMTEVGLAIDFSGYTEYEKGLIRTSVFEFAGREANRISRMMQEEHNRGNPYGAEVIENTVTAPGTGDNN